MVASVALLSRLFTGGGPSWQKGQAQIFVSDLREAAGRARVVVEDVSGLSVAPVPVRIVDRSVWANQAIASIKAMMDAQSGLLKLKDNQIGFATSVLSMKVLGQYDPYSINPSLYLVAPNIADFYDQSAVNQADVGLWVAVHEWTHVAQFQAAPWLAEYIGQRASVLVSADDDAVVDATLDEITAIMSLLEGHATYVMNNVSYDVLPCRSSLIDAMAKRRAAGGAMMKRLEKMLGLAKKAQQYSQGNEFVEAVVKQMGLDGFNRVWLSPQNAPTVEQLHNPAEWIASVS
ncbi:putative hydrolase [Arcanobacterium phocae]|uniref:Putative hydrolase n=1 Tax=Arcanobacterium phocae TaxID=131112 RepID=A0A1H2LA00_9ACTO|nr:zinc-dependent metalloprotease [Arcanobacterium phocae]SDU77833.1 putative hydrolase [Arcanobacterium phocae]